MSLPGYEADQNITSGILAEVPTGLSGLGGGPKIDIRVRNDLSSYKTFYRIYENTNAANFDDLAGLRTTLDVPTDTVTAAPGGNYYRINELGDRFVVDYVGAEIAGLLDLESLSDSARGSTIATIYNNLSAFGSGALSLSWRGGFSEIYGQNFFLSDVGIFATFFRFGVIFAPVILIITFLFFWAPYKKSVQTSQRVAVSVSAIALILLIPTGAIFEHKSVLLAIVVAMGYAGNMFSKRIRVRFTSTAFNA